MTTPLYRSVQRSFGHILQEIKTKSSKSRNEDGDFRFDGFAHKEEEDPFLYNKENLSREKMYEELKRNTERMKKHWESNQNSTFTESNQVS